MFSTFFLHKTWFLLHPLPCLLCLTKCIPFLSMPTLNIHIHFGPQSSNPVLSSSSSSSSSPPPPSSIPTHKMVFGGGWGGGG